MPSGTCVWCGSGFFVEESKSNNKRISAYCSRSCYMKQRAKKREEKFGPDLCKSCFKDLRVPGEKRCWKCKTDTKRASRRRRDVVAHKRAVCSQCGEEKRLGLFPSRRTRGGFQPSSICVTCRDKNVVNGKKHCGWCDEYREERFFVGGVKKSSTRSTCTFCSRGIRYGATGNDIIELLEKQQHTCPVCLNPLDIVESPNAVHVDHCHSTGLVRGIVCSSCNFMLGHSMDSPENLRRAAEYLVNPPALLYLGKRLAPIKDEPMNWEADLCQT